MTEAEQQQQEAEKRNADLAKCYKRMSQTDDGKKIMADLESVLGFKRTSIDGCWDANRTFYHEGMRNAYLYILQKIERKERKDG